MFVVMNSANVKIGAAAATYAPIKATCPSTCKLRDNGCYAQTGNVGFQVNRLEREMDGIGADTIAVMEGDEIFDQARHAPAGHPLRIHVSGDATTEFRAIQMARGAAAWPGPVWSYTHAWREVSRKSWGIVSVLASCESTADVAEALNAGYAPALVVSHHPENGRSVRDENGIKLIPCPSQTRDVSCADCRLCWNDEMLIAQRACITFSVHGVAKKRALNVLQPNRPLPLAA